MTPLSGTFPYTFRLGFTGPVSRIVALLLVLFAVEFPDTTLGDKYVDFYSILEVTKSATQSDIRKSYRRLSLQWHPDKAVNKKEATEKFQRINNAYDVLTDADNRRYYDFYGIHYKGMKEYFDEYIRPNRIKELYEFKQDIVILFDKNADEILAESNFTWIVTFYHPSCGSCQRTVPVFTQLAQLATKTKRTRIGVMNCAASMYACNRFNIEHLGKIYIFPPGQDRGGFWEQRSYDGVLNAHAILEAANNIPESEVVRIKQETEIYAKLTLPIGLTKVAPPVEAIWILDYYKPSCGPCRQLKAELRQISANLKGIVKIAAIDCSEQYCDAPFFPYLRLFVRRRKSAKVERIHLDYSHDGHPGGQAILIAGLILKEVLGLRWEAMNPTKSDAERKDEL